ncbi:MAG: 4Fe-4S binding protein, partial [Desulfocucumaceae bacterium]
KGRCRPDDCENGVCIATYSCNWKILVQDKPHDQPQINLSRCLGCARCTFICPRGALKIIER